MKTDCELLTLAAKAAGVFMTRDQWPYSCPATDEDFAQFFDEEDMTITGPIVWYGSDGEVGGTDQLTWDPLYDDGDAFRLAGKVEMSIDIAGPVVKVFRHDIAGCLEKGNDRAGNARRAIVRAAAAIGEAKP